MSLSNLDRSDLLSYENIFHLRQKFRQAGGRNSSEFNLFDQPGHQFFRILFHFIDDARSDVESVISPLLHPTWGVTNILDDGSDGQHMNELQLWQYSSAWSYLMQNGEADRASNLRKFIEILSNISAESPWYFTAVKGLDTALTRTQTMDQFSIKERKKITIECLPDALDNRIGTLLDLYRSVVWSWQTKRAIVPANLRKFDMSIVIMQTPIQSLHTPSTEPQLSDALGMVGKLIQSKSSDYASGALKTVYQTSFKIIELHNCEIDYNSSASGYTEIKNDEGFEQKYNIDILFDDCVETRFNEFLDGVGEITDSIAIDIADKKISDNGQDIEGEVFILQELKRPAWTAGSVGSRFTPGEERWDNITTGSYSQVYSIYQAKLADALQAIAADGAAQNLDKETIEAAQAKMTEGYANSYRIIRAVDVINQTGPSPNKLGDRVLRRSQKDIGSKLIGQLTGGVTGFLSSKVNKLILGNLFGLSIANVVKSAQNLLSGNIGKLANVGNLITDPKNALNSAIGGLPQKNFNGYKDMEKPYTNYNSESAPTATQVQQLGNLFATQSYINSTR